MKNRLMLCAAELFHKKNDHKNHSQNRRKPPQDQKLMRKGMILSHRHTLDHCLKIQGKRKNHHGSHSQNLCCLSRRNSKDPFGLTFHQNNIGKKYNSSCYHKVNNKIPEIRPVEHTEKHCRQKDLRHEKLFSPEFPCPRLSQNKIFFPYHFYPGI